MQKTIQKKKAKSGRWTRAQHQKFLQALEKYGRDWIKIQKKIKTRTLLQIRSHAQKVFLNMSDNDIQAFIDCDSDQSFELNQNSSQYLKIKEQQDQNVVFKHKAKRSAKEQTKRNDCQSSQNSTLEIGCESLERSKSGSQQNEVIICNAICPSPCEGNRRQNGKQQQSMFIEMFKQHEKYLLDGGNLIGLILNK